ncbi:universal stress protein [Pseudonocardia halophobica]|uniref:Universal stress protein n=1 Tax=Pseudonocardia halophobica TaxID=29401 RepID=A0A9W6NUJ8_9PSEU|nr:universal stress protein [Pseudonocardia halophobica]GLL09536.1 universal stress protein [Pseudonocardia halophobica]
MSSDVGRAVVVGVDGSDSALDATRWAAAEAARRGCGLRLVAAVAHTMFRPIGVPQLGQEYQRRVWERAAEEHLTAAVAAAQDVAAGVDVQQEVRAGEARMVLHSESERAALVVLGSRGRGGFTGLLLGSVAISVAAGAACPVVVVRGTRAPGGPVVVGVDGHGAADEPALLLAFEEAALRGAPLVAVHTWSGAVLDPFLVPTLDPKAVLAEEEQLLEERVAPWRGKYPAVEVRLAVAFDGAARELVTHSEGAGLVVVGSRGLGSFSGLAMGSVSQAVLHHAACPVAVVRPDAADHR